MVSVDEQSSLTHFTLEPINNSLHQGIITVDKSLIDQFYRQAALYQQQTISSHGFAKGNVPLTYIEQHYKTTLIHHVKEFLFKYLIINTLYYHIREKKILVAGEPRLVSVHVEPHENAQYIFELTLFPSIELHEWKYFLFKAPKRKKYKDLDRQVETFIEEEKERMKGYLHMHAQMDDWVNFDVALINEKKEPFLKTYAENLWLKLGNEEADSALYETFAGKQNNESFVTQNKGMQEYFSNDLDTHYNFLITIKDIVPHAYFCLESFKKYFKLKTNKEMYQKFIEVFSYRNDLSQRRSMVEEALKLLLSKHRFSIPNHLILRQQQKVLHAIQSNPDYHVYRMQKDFNDRLEQLAEKQAKESLIIDQISYHENINATMQDIRTYINLMKRPRTKEFIYFTPPSSKLRGQEIPISTEELKIACRREKTLNHVIYHLTQK